MANDILIEPRAKQLIGFYVDAFHDLMSGESNWVDNHVPKIKSALEHIDKVKKHQTGLFQHFLEIGNSLNILQVHTKIRGMKWGRFCKQHFGIPDTTLRRYRTVAGECIHKDHYRLGFTRVHAIVCAIRAVDATLDVNTILESTDFTDLKTADCKQAAKCAAQMYLARNDDALRELNLDLDTVEAFIKTNGTPDDFDLTEFTKKMSDIPAHNRNDALLRMVAAGSQNGPKETRKEKTESATSIHTLYYSSVGLFDQSEQELGEQEQLEIEQIDAWIARLLDYKKRILQHKQSSGPMPEAEEA